MSRRVVLDTSMLVSAALRVGSVLPYQALLEALGAWDVCASVETLAELEQVLGREKFDRYLDGDSRRKFVAVIRRNAHLFAVQSADLAAVDPPCRDARDNQFLAWLWRRKWMLSSAAMKTCWCWIRGAGYP